MLRNPPLPPDVRNFEAAASLESELRSNADWLREEAAELSDGGDQASAAQSEARADLSDELAAGVGDLDPALLAEFAAALDTDTEGKLWGICLIELGCCITAATTSNLCRTFVAATKYLPSDHDCKNLVEFWKQYSRAGHG